MSKKKKIQKQPSESFVRACEHRLLFARRIEERISIINRYILDGIPLSENDEHVLRAVMDWYEDDLFSWLSRELSDREKVKQVDIFPEVMSQE